MFFFDESIDKKIDFETIEYAYLCIVSDDLDAAQKIFLKIDSPRANWGKKLVDIIKGYVEIFPTYFEIRNFLEIDLDFLIKNKKIDYVEQILGSLDYLVEINQETYKYVGRVMYENRLYNSSIKYLEKSKKILYSDPELHFLLAKYYMNFRMYSEALFYINECIRILPEYYPARLLRQEINKFID